eukprot:1159175-Pelagomonas_calceolata.AAC.17
MPVFDAQHSPYATSSCLQHAKLAFSLKQVTPHTKKWVWTCPAVYHPCWHRIGGLTESITSVRHVSIRREICLESWAQELLTEFIIGFLSSSPVVGIQNAQNTGSQQPGTLKLRCKMFYEHYGFTVPEWGTCQISRMDPTV